MLRGIFNFGFLRKDSRRHTGRRRGAPKSERYRPELLDLESRTLLSTINWLRPVNGDWDDPANWSGGQVPGANDDAVIPFVNIQITHATAAADTIHSLTSEAAIDLSAGSLSVGVLPFTTQRIASRIDAPVRVDGGALTLNQIDLGGAGTLTNFASLNVNSSTINVAVDNEAGVLASTAQFSSIIINNQAQRPFVNGPAATLRLLGVSSVTFANGFTNDGMVEVQSAAHRSAPFVVASGTLVNAPDGTIRLLGGSTSSVMLNADLDNQGLITTRSALFSKLSGTLINDGSMDILSGTVNNNEAFTNNGAITIDSGGTFTVAGARFDQNGTVDGPGMLMLFGTTANFPGDLSNAVTRLSIQNTTLNLGGTLTNAGTLDISGSTINAPLDNEGMLSVRSAGAAAVLNGPFTNENGATLSVGGLLTLARGFTNDGSIHLGGTFADDNPTLTIASATLTNAADGVITSQGGLLNAVVDNQGMVTIARNTILTGAVANEGTIDVHSGDLQVNPNEGNPDFINTGTLTIESLAAVAVDGVGFDGGSFRNAGTVTIGLFGTLQLAGGYLQTGGLTVLEGGSLTAGDLVNLGGGVLAGSGTINANVLNQAEVDVGAPGSPGVLTINGDYTQEGALLIEIGGANPGTDFDQLNVTGQATLDPNNATLTVNLINGFVPTSGDSFPILTFSAGTGVFAAINGDGVLFTPSFNAGDVTLVAN
jgi:hypothetical protein